MTLIEKIRGIEQQWQKEVERLTVRQLEFVEMEEAAQEFGRCVARAALAWLLAAAGKGYEGSSMACACRGRMKFQRYAERPVRTLMPESTVKEWAKLISPNIHWPGSDFCQFCLFT